MNVEAYIYSIVVINQLNSECYILDQNQIVEWLFVCFDTENCVTEEGKLKVKLMGEYFSQCLKKMIRNNRRPDYADEVMDKFNDILQDIRKYSKDAREAHMKILDIFGSQISPLMSEVFRQDKAARP